MSWLARKRLGLSGPQYGPELVVNTEFATNTTGYVVTNATWTRVDSSSDPGVGSGGLDVYCGKVAVWSASGRGRYVVTLEVGKTYKVTCRAYAVDGGKAGISFSAGNGYDSSMASHVTGSSVWETLELTAVATTTTTYIILIPRSAAVNSASGDIAYFDALSIREVL